MKINVKTLKLNLNDSTLCTWLRLYRENGDKGLESLTKSGRQKGKLYKKRVYLFTQSILFN